MYKMVDFRKKYRPGVANNCHHSVTDIAPASLISTGTAFGEPYGPILVQHFRPWMVNPGQTHNWVAEKLRLEKFQVDFRNPPF